MNHISKNLFIRLRIAAISFKNELSTIFTDPGALLILIGAILLYPIAYSIAYNKQVLNEIPIAVVDLDNTQGSRQLGRMLDASEKLHIVAQPASLREAELLFWNGEVKGILLIESDFEKNTLKAQPSVLGVYCDASYFLVYKETLTAGLRASATYGAGIEIRKLIASGSSVEQAKVQSNPLQAQYHALYNPAGSYGSFVMPGMLIVILQQTILIGIGLVSGASREKKMHFSMPGMNFKGGSVSTLMGRALAYFMVLLLTSSFALVWIYDWFGFPSRGSYGEILAMLVPFGFSTIFLGLAVSFLFHKREQSIMFLVFLSPIALFMSGISWPMESMPVAIQYLAKILPGTFMVPAYLRLRTMGVGLVNVQSEMWNLYIQATIYFGLAVLLYRAMKRRQKREDEEQQKLALRKKVLNKLSRKL